MDTKYLEKCMKDIQVKNLVNEDVEVVNNSPLLMIGKGRQGAVFKFTEDICVKVFGNIEDCEREYYALTLGQKSTLFPRLYGKGDLYIAMEIIKGVDVREYLQSQPLTAELSRKLIHMLITFKEIGYDRIDHHKRQIYLQPDGSLKVIDVARAVWRDRVYPYPRKLLTSLGEQNKNLFLFHVETFAPDLYEEWLHYIRMEELSREIYQIMISSPSDEKALSALSKNLLTTGAEEIYVRQLENLMHKVFKEEWIKTMLAKGHDPEAILGKIEHFLQKGGRVPEKEMRPFSNRKKSAKEREHYYLDRILSKSAKPEKSRGRMVYPVEETEARRTNPHRLKPSRFYYSG